MKAMKIGLPLAAVGAMFLLSWARAAEVGRQAGNVVRMAGMSFQPRAITVTAGDTVTWRNDSGVVQTVTDDPALATHPSNAALPDGAGPISSGDIAPGDTFQYTFTVPGVYRYFSMPQETKGMVASVLVRPAPKAATGN